MNTVIADYSKAEHQAAIKKMMAHYAQDQMGGGEALSSDVLDRLVDGLATFGKAFTVLAYVDQQPVGLVNCIEGYSTFKAAPLINIHDAVVLEGFRGKGILQSMFAAVERVAQEKECCKLTLEVLEGNAPAQKAYENFGFSGYELDPKMGKAVFWQKKLK